MTSEQFLTPGESIVSPNGLYRLTLGTDGTLILYDKDGNALWSAGTFGATQAKMQDDGNFVLYGPDKTPLWSSGTVGRRGAFLQIQNDGTVGIFDGDKRIWP
jgi:hypothetical protein